MTEEYKNLLVKFCLSMGYKIEQQGDEWVVVNEDWTFSPPKGELIREERGRFPTELAAYKHAFEISLEDVC